LQPGTPFWVVGDNAATRLFGTRSNGGLNQCYLGEAHNFWYAAVDVSAQQNLVTISCGLAVQRKVLLTIRITKDQANPVLQFELSALMVM
jgi:hypothetical protein